MEKYNNWKRKFYAIWAGQAVSLIIRANLLLTTIGGPIQIPRRRSGPLSSELLEKI